MRNFKLYHINKNNKTLISFSQSWEDIDKINNQQTFDEILVQNNNSQYELTFSLKKYIKKDLLNNNFNLLKIGAKTLLDIDNSKEIEFVINSISSSIEKGDIVYTYSCQDYFSYSLTRKGVGYFHESEQPENIFEICAKVLKHAHLDTTWTSSGDLKLIQKRITFNIDNSNLYNTIVEACMLFGYDFNVDYTNKVIEFYDISEIKPSGYAFRPETNLSGGNINYDNLNSCSLLFVQGGVDLNGNVVSLIPPMTKKIRTYFSNNDYETKTNQEILDGLNDLSSKTEEDIEWINIFQKIPALTNFLYDFNYYKEIGMITDEELNIINNIFNINLRNNNIVLNKLTTSKLDLEIKIKRIQEDIFGLAEQRNAILLSEDANEKCTDLKEIEIKIRDLLRGNDYFFFNAIFKLYGYDNDYNIDDYDILKYYTERAQYYTSEADKIQTQLSGLEGESESEEVEAEKLALENKRKLYLSLSEFLLGTSDDDDAVTGLYKYLYDIIADIFNNLDPKPAGGIVGILTSIKEKQVLNSELLTYIYSTFCDIINEAYFSNVDELNSTNLYNTAVAYFEKQKRPVLSCNIDTIDIAALEPIDIPRLEVGNSVDLYSDIFLNKKEKEKFIVTVGDNATYARVGFSIFLPKNTTFTVSMKVKVISGTFSSTPSTEHSAVWLRNSLTGTRWGRAYINLNTKEEQIVEFISTDNDVRPENVFLLLYPKQAKAQHWTSENLIIEYYDISIKYCGSDRNFFVYDDIQQASDVSYSKELKISKEQAIITSITTPLRNPKEMQLSIDPVDKTKSIIENLLILA